MTIQPLRFAMVTTFYPPFNFGGDGIFVQRLARALVARGHSVDVIHDTDAYRMLSGHAPQIPFEDDGVRVHRLRSPHKTLSSLGVQQLGRPTTHRARLEELLTGRYDVINYHNISLVGGPGLWPIGTGIKIHTAHEYWLVCPTHLLWKQNREICENRQCLRCTLSYKRPPQYWRMTDKMHRDAEHVDMFLMLAKSAEEHHRRNGFRRPMTTIPSFLPDAATKLKSAGTGPRRRPYFLFVGRLEEIKGLQDVIPHFDDDLPADLLIAGTGEYENTLREQAKGRLNVHFLGRKSEEDLRHLYRDALATVIPSRWLEVFPLVTMESFREGTPIIARDVGAFPEVVRDTGGGYVFHTGEDLRSILHRMANDPAHAAELGRKGFTGYARNWREDVALSAYFRVIEEAAAKRGMTDLLAKLNGGKSDRDQAAPA